jgi:hypothetical protein
MGVPLPRLQRYFGPLYPSAAALTIAGFEAVERTLAPRIEVHEVYVAESGGVRTAAARQIHNQDKCGWTFNGSGLIAATALIGENPILPLQERQRIEVVAIRRLRGGNCAGVSVDQAKRFYHRHAHRAPTRPIGTPARRGRRLRHIEYDHAIIDTHRGRCR